MCPLFVILPFTLQNLSRRDKFKAVYKNILPDFIPAGFTLSHITQHLLHFAYCCAVLMISTNPCFKNQSSVK